MAADTLAAAQVIQIPAPVQPEPPLPEEPPGPEGTLLAIVPIPGTVSSLAIWGYRVPRDVTPAGPVPPRGRRLAASSSITPGAASG